MVANGRNVSVTNVINGSLSVITSHYLKLYSISCCYIVVSRDSKLT